MRKNHFFALLLSGLFSTALHAQKDFLPVTLTLNNGDTVQGLVNYQNWSRTPSVIEFRRSPDAASETYTVRTLQGFQVKGTDKYQRSVIWRQTENPVLSAERYQPSPARHDTVFLRSIVEAPKLALYEYVDEKTHYFIQPAGDTLQELLNPSIYDASTGQFKTRAIYQDQLKKYALGQERQQQLFRQIEVTPYREAHLQAIVARLNGIEKASYVPSSKGVSSRQAFVAAGVIFSTTFPDSDPAGLVSSYKKTSWQVSGGLDFFTLKNFQHLFVRTELRLGTSSYEAERRETNYRGDLQQHQYQVDNLYVNPAVHLLFPFLRTEKARLYGGAGISYTILESLKYNHTVTDYATGTEKSGPIDYYASARGWGGPLLTLGWMYQKKFEIRVFRNLGGMLIPETTSKYNGVLVGYRF